MENHEVAETSDSAESSSRAEEFPLLCYKQQKREILKICISKIIAKRKKRKYKSHHTKSKKNSKKSKKTDPPKDQAEIDAEIHREKIRKKTKESEMPLIRLVMIKNTINMLIGEVKLVDKKNESSEMNYYYDIQRPCNSEKLDKRMDDLLKKLSRKPSDTKKKCTSLKSDLPKNDVTSDDCSENDGPSTSEKCSVQLQKSNMTEVENDDKIEMKNIKSELSEDENIDDNFDRDKPSTSRNCSVELLKDLAMEKCNMLKVENDAKMVLETVKSNLLEDADDIFVGEKPSTSKKHKSEPIEHLKLKKCEKLQNRTKIEETILKSDVSEPETNNDDFYIRDKPSVSKKRKCEPLEHLGLKKNTNHKEQNHTNMEEKTVKSDYLKNEFYISEKPRTCRKRKGEPLEHLRLKKRKKCKHYTKRKAKSVKSDHSGGQFDCDDNFIRVIPSTSKQVKKRKGEPLYSSILKKDIVNTEIMEDNIMINISEDKYDSDNHSQLDMASNSKQDKKPLYSSVLKKSSAKKLQYKAVLKIEEEPLETSASEDESCNKKKPKNKPLSTLVAKKSTPK